MKYIIKDNQYNIVGIAYKAWSNSIASGYTYSMTRNPSVVRSRLASGAEFDWTMLHPHAHRDKNTADLNFVPCRQSTSPFSRGGKWDSNLLFFLHSLNP